MQPRRSRNSSSIRDRYAVTSKAIIYKEELEYISRCVLDYPDIETGGDLFGFWTYSGYPVIQYVIGPGSNSNHQVAFFNQDVDYLRSIGTRLRQEHGLQHIGEWHSHHRLGLAEPSGHDINTVTKAIRNYNLSRFLLVITNIVEEGTSVNGFLFSNSKGRQFDYSGWVILDGMSPIRSSFDEKYHKAVYRPETKDSALTDVRTTSLHNNSYVKPEYKPEYWLSKPENHLVLKRILDELNRKFSQLNVFQDSSDNSVYLDFSHRDMELRLSFSHLFPNSPPQIFELKDKSPLREIKEPEVNWILSQNVAESTLDYLFKALQPTR
jgi:hypothetical protein